MGLFRIERFDTVVSTNEIVKHAIEVGYDEGLVCRAAEQVGGYGRQGRTWSSPRGGLYQSILLRPVVPDAQLPTFGLVVALAVRQALLGLTGADASSVLVKWPNDVVCAQGKLVGISSEAHAGGLCIGIGVNVARPASTPDVGGKNTPAYAAELAAAWPPADESEEESVEAVGDAILAELEPLYLRWRDGGFAPFVDEFNACNALAGKHVDIANRTGAIVESGPVMGVDADGSLLVGGTPIASGEAHLRS